MIDKLTGSDAFSALDQNDSPLKLFASWFASSSVSLLALTSVPSLFFFFTVSRTRDDNAIFSSSEKTSLSLHVGEIVGRTRYQYATQRGEGKLFKRSDGGNARNGRIFI